MFCFVVINWYIVLKFCICMWKWIDLLSSVVFLMSECVSFEWLLSVIRLWLSNVLKLIDLLVSG